MYFFQRVANAGKTRGAFCPVVHEQRLASASDGERTLVLAQLRTAQGRPKSQTAGLPPAETWRIVNVEGPFHGRGACRGCATRDDVGRKRPADPPKEESARIRAGCEFVASEDVPL